MVLSKDMPLKQAHPSGCHVDSQSKEAQPEMFSSPELEL